MSFPGAAVKTAGGGITSGCPGLNSPRGERPVRLFRDQKMLGCGRRGPGGGGGHTDNVQTGGTRWGGVGSAGMEEKGRGPAGITPPPILIPIPILSQCPVMKPLPSQYSPAVSIPCPHLSPLGARCVLAFVSQSCCLPVPISFCPINPRHESR